jgi:hypothetical protein
VTYFRLVSRYWFTLALIESHTADPYGERDCVDICLHGFVSRDFPFLLQVLFTLAVIESHTAPSPTRQVMGFITVPSRLYPWVLLVLLQVGEVTWCRILRYLRIMTWFGIGGGKDLNGYNTAPSPTRQVMGFITVPSRLYPWVLLVLLRVMTWCRIHASSTGAGMIITYRRSLRLCVVA